MFYAHMWFLVVTGGVEPDCVVGTNSDFFHVRLLFLHLNKCRATFSSETLKVVDHKPGLGNEKSKTMVHLKAG